MRRYSDGTYGETHSLSCAFCEEEDWGYKLVTGSDPERVVRPPIEVITAVCPDCFEGFPEDWHNADDLIPPPTPWVPANASQGKEG